MVKTKLIVNGERLMVKKAEDAEVSPAGIILKAAKVTSDRVEIVAVGDKADNDKFKPGRVCIVDPEFPAYYTKIDEQDIAFIACEMVLAVLE